MASALFTKTTPKYSDEKKSANFVRQQVWIKGVLAGKLRIPNFSFSSVAYCIEHCNLHHGFGMLNCWIYTVFHHCIYYQLILLSNLSCSHLNSIMSFYLQTIQKIQNMICILVWNINNSIVREIHTLLGL